VRDCTGVGLQLLNVVLGMPVEGHVEEINGYRCPVSTARHFYLARQCHFAPLRTGDCARPGCPICRPRLVVTNLHLALATAQKLGCTAEQIDLITGSLFIELFSALCATLPVGTKLVLQFTAGAAEHSADTTHQPPAVYARDGRLCDPAAVGAHSMRPASSVSRRRRLACRPPPRPVQRPLGAAARLRLRARALHCEVCWRPKLLPSGGTQ